MKVEREDVVLRICGRLSGVSSNGRCGNGWSRCLPWVISRVISGEEVVCLRLTGCDGRSIRDAVGRRMRGFRSTR
jgi:hypothetical protein